MTSAFFGAPQDITLAAGGAHRISFLMGRAVAATTVVIDGIQVLFSPGTSGAAAAAARFASVEEPVFAHAAHWDGTNEPGQFGG